MKSYLESIWLRHSDVSYASVGDEWYPVVSSWLKKWREGNASLGPIDNVSLADKNGRIKKELKESRDFEFVNAFLWAQLTELYGHTSPSLKVYVREPGITEVFRTLSSDRRLVRIRNKGVKETKYTAVENFFEYHRDIRTF